jgi:coronin-1B/1C/6
MLFDPRNLKSPIVGKDIDSSASLLMPFYDEDTSIMYLAGKGDSNIR